MDRQIEIRCSREWEPEFSGSIWEWAEGMALPQSTRAAVFRPEESPWLLEPFEALARPEIKEVVLIAPAGGAKSLLAEIFIAWVIKNYPGTCYYVTQSDEDARDAVEDRILKMLLANQVTAELVPSDKSKRRAAKIIFPGMELYALGANINNAQSKRVKILIMDEAHAYLPGLLAAFRKRTNAVSGAKTLIISTGSITDDETDQAWKSGDMREFHVCCPSCGHFQIMRNAMMRYESSERTMDSDGNYRMRETRESVTFECDNASCACRWPNRPDTRRAILQGAHYRPTNPNASEGRGSFHFPAHAVPWIDWADLAEEWITANRAAAFGAMKPRKDYVQKQLAESWDESPREEDHLRVGFRVGGYVKREKWDQELTRFCTADQQAKKFYCVCAAYSATGETRIVDAAVLQTFEEYEAWRIENGTEAARTGIDIAFNTSVTQQRCAQYGWTGLWGDDRKHWPHDLRSPWHPVNIAKYARQPHSHIEQKPVMLPFSPKQKAQAGLGLAGKLQLAIYYYWSNPAVKDMWHHLFDGLGASWTHASDIGKLYVAQTLTEIKTLTYSKITGRKEWRWIVPSKKSGDEMKQDHYLDASQMNLAMALMDDRIALSATLIGAVKMKEEEAILQETT